MYPSTALHKLDNPPRKLVDKLPVCVFYANGETLYAFEASWQNLFDFIKIENREVFEVKCDPLSDSWQSANDQPWGVRFRVPVLFRCVAHPYGTTISLKTGRWQNNYHLAPGQSRLISHKWLHGKHLIVQQSWLSFKG